MTLLFPKQIKEKKYYEALITCDVIRQDIRNRVICDILVIFPVNFLPIIYAGHIYLRYFHQRNPTWIIRVNSRLFYSFPKYVDYEIFSGKWKKINSSNFKVGDFILKFSNYRNLCWSLNSKNFMLKILTSPSITKTWLLIASWVMMNMFAMYLLMAILYLLRSSEVKWNRRTSEVH